MTQNLQKVSEKIVSHRDVVGQSTEFVMSNRNKNLSWNITTDNTVKWHWTQIRIYMYRSAQIWSLYEVYKKKTLSRTTVKLQIWCFLGFVSSVLELVCSCFWLLVCREPPHLVLLWHQRAVVEMVKTVMYNSNHDNPGTRPALEVHPIWQTEDHRVDRKIKWSSIYNELCPLLGRRTFSAGCTITLRVHIQWSLPLSTDQPMSRKIEYEKRISRQVFHKRDHCRVSIMTMQCP